MPTRKVTPEMIEEIRRRWIARETLRSIADDMGLHYNTVHRYSSPYTKDRMYAQGRTPEALERNRTRSREYQRKKYGWNPKGSPKVARPSKKVAKEQVAPKAPSMRLVFANDGGKWGWHLRPVPGSGEAPQ